MNSFYFWINIGILAIPFFSLFDGKVSFFSKWAAWLPALVLTSILFLPWDQWFVEMNVWGFNARYILGYYMLDLPVEEIMFLFTFPFACTFIYEFIRTRMKPNETFEELYRWFTLLFFGTACTLLYWFNDRLYTAITCLVLTLMLGTHLMVIRRRYMSWFYFVYMICLVLMLIVNGLLSAKPVIFYNDMETVGVRFIGIPVENFLYNLAMLAMCIGLYEWFNRWGLRYRLRRQKQSS